MCRKEIFTSTFAPHSNFPIMQNAIYYGISRRSDSCLKQKTSHKPPKPHGMKTLFTSPRRMSRNGLTMFSRVPISSRQLFSAFVSDTASFFRGFQMDGVEKKTSLRKGGITDSNCFKEHRTASCLQLHKIEQKT